MASLTAEDGVALTLVDGEELAEINGDFGVFNLPYVFDSPAQQADVLGDADVIEALPAEDLAWLRACAAADQRDHLAAVDDRSTRTMGIAIRVFNMLCRFGARGNRSELVGLAAVLGTGFFLVRADETTVGAVTAAHGPT